MFESVFNMFTMNKSWCLRPVKYPKESKDNYSNRVLLPYFILRDLANFNYLPPYLFEISHQNGAYRTICGVKDFALENDEIHVPGWIFEQIALDSSEEVVVNSIKVEKGEGIKLLPHSVEFLEVEDPKSELERGLREYPVLSYGDEILLSFEDIGNCRFTVTEVYPSEYVSIYLVDTDLHVDFDEPIGYKEKIESERSVLKYVSIVPGRGDIQGVRLKRVGLALDWDAINKMDVAVDRPASPSGKKSDK